MFAPNQWPAYFREARGCEVWDTDGRHYFDLSFHGIGACLLGYRDPDVTRAVTRRVTLGSFCTLNAPEEVTLAEVLSESGYNTVHIGKWHMGDIMESWPNHQGFDFAAFPIHQQGQLTIFNDDAANEEITLGIGKNNYDDRSMLREKVAGDVFRNAGLAGSHTAFFTVYVDHGEGPVYFGVYTMVEEVDDTVLDDQFADGFHAVELLND